MTAATVVRTAAFLPVLALGCATPGTSSTPTTPVASTAATGAAEKVYRLLEGRFDSADQARSTPGYASFQIVACPADAASLGQRVLYVEQTRTGAEGEPYRQRVYAVAPGEPLDSAAELRVFELAVSGSSVGACGSAVPPRFTRDELVERVGCAIVIRADGPVFRGATQGRGCPTTEQGATYVTYELVLDSVGFRSWERGFDAGGTKRWGTDTGPYVFVRRTPLRSP